MRKVRELIKKMIINYLLWRKDRLSTVVTVPTSGTTSITKEMEEAIRKSIQ